MNSAMRSVRLALLLFAVASAAACASAREAKVAIDEARIELDRSRVYGAFEDKRPIPEGAAVEGANIDGKRPADLYDGATADFDEAERMYAAGRYDKAVVHARDAAAVARRIVVGAKRLRGRR